MIKLFGCLFFMIMSGCFQSESQAPIRQIQVTDIPSDFMIPHQFMKAVESDLLLESKILTPVYIFTTLEVLFKEKTPGTLSSPAQVFRFPKGGGAIDLQTLVTGQGSFYMSFPPDQFKDLPPLEHLYYISHTPKKKIGDEEFGLGCAKWVDIQSRFEDLQKVDFLNLNTTDNRHLFVLAGHYVFVFRNSNQVHLAQLTITDSKNAFQLCPKTKGSFL
ncbi:MAG: hypothetical protein A2622_02625 [Bdellovibrionales bacterium RIFCSPHIGHO2_01_FULL_40_29]|nr:MAG: hypothetical protein A2622_02625 [Bdellovibrionales bacterium RIFCSPHIGHO2_01_FULL_40_29]OFZ33976.1 MAG: hypothetical protein A3D17_03045 [Bdellovibrionales bacterium RIFCSPHIGHO2_02_FULL_40_15]